MHRVKEVKKATFDRTAIGNEAKCVVIHLHVSIRVKDYSVSELLEDTVGNAKIVEIPLTTLGVQNLDSHITGRQCGGLAG